MGQKVSATILIAYSIDKIYFLRVSHSSNNI